MNECYNIVVAVKVATAVVLYGTLEYISNVPYYGIFIINPCGVMFCLISPLLLLFMLTVGSCIEQT